MQQLDTEQKNVKIAIISQRKDTCIESWLQLISEKCLPNLIDYDNVDSQLKYHIVFIDRRHSAEADRVCRLLRNQNPLIVLVAIVKNQSKLRTAVCTSKRNEIDKSDFNDLLSIGYNYKVQSAKKDGLDELELLIEMVKTNRKLERMDVLQKALDSCQDAVEIRDSNYYYANNAHKRLLADRRPSLPDEYNIKFKTQKQQTLNGYQITIQEREQLTQIRRKDSFLQRFTQHQNNLLDGPIMKIIQVLSSMKEKVGLDINQDLDFVLDLLTSQKLYEPFRFDMMRVQDDVASDYVGGLISTTSVKRKQSGECKSIHSNSLPLNHIIDSSLDKFREYLEDDDKWTFDIIKFQTITERPLSYLALKIFRRFNVSDQLCVDESKLFNWLNTIESHYRSNNPYHNSTHGGDVLHATAYFLNRPKMQSIMESNDVLGALLAAIIHDVDHPGRTNPFLVNSQNKLAILYNDISVLESHHVSLAFQLTFNPSLNINIFEKLTKDDYKLLRSSIIDLVLATDMTKHFTILQQFISCMKPLHCIDNDIDSQFDQETLDSLTTNESKSLILRTVIKCADISNPLKPRKLCVEWAKRIADEYFNQTDEENELKLPVSMANFDRKNCKLAKCQTGFISFFVRDLFEAFHELIAIPEPIRFLEENDSYWKSVE